VLIRRHAACDQEDTGVPWRIHQFDARVQRQNLTHRARIHPNGDKNRRWASGRKASQKAYCHRNTPSRQA
jgi:hypothetical protein